MRNETTIGGLDAGHLRGCVAAVFAGDAPHDVEAVYVFGSRATGRYRPDSDLDLAIVFRRPGPDMDALYIQSRQSWTGSLSSDLRVKVDLQVATPGTDAIVWPAVQREGIEVYRRRPID